MAVDGRLRIDSFQTDEGERRKVIEVVADTVQFLGGGSGGGRKPVAEGESVSENTAAGESITAGETAAPPKEAAKPGVEDDDEEVPF